MPWNGKASIDVQVGLLLMLPHGLASDPRTGRNRFSREQKGKGDQFKTVRIISIMKGSDKFRQCGEDDAMNPKLVTEERLSNVFITALLLTGSLTGSDEAMVEGIRSWDIDEAPDEGLLRATVAAAMAQSWELPPPISLGDR
jgi:hypothetical protein